MKIFYGEKIGDLIDQALLDVGQKNIKWPDRRAFIVVPETSKAYVEKRYLELLQHLQPQEMTATLMMVDVVSFQRLAHRLIAEVGGLKEDYLDPVMKTMLIYRIIEENKSLFPILSPLTKRISYLKELEPVLSEFSRYQLKQSQFFNLEKTPENQKFLELAVLLEKVEQNALQAGYVDQLKELDILNEMLAKINLAPSSLRWPYNRLSYLFHSSVWILGFGQNRLFTPQEWSVIQALHHTVENLTISLASDIEPTSMASIQMGSPVFYFGRQTFWDLKKKITSYGTEKVENKRTNHPDIDSLATYFFTRQKVKGMKPLEAIEFWGAEDVTEELSLVAGKIKELVLLQGYAYQDIKIILCNPSGYESKIGSVFRQYTLDPFFDKRQPLSDSVVMTFVLGLLDLSIYGWSFKNMMQVLKTGLCPLPLDQICFLENYCLKNGFYRGDKLFHLLDSDIEGDKETERIKDIVRKILLPLRDFIKHMRHLTTCQTKSQSLLAFLHDFGGKIPDFSLFSQIEALSEELLQTKEQNQAFILVSAWNKLLEILTKLIQEVEEVFISNSNFRNLLFSGMEAAFSGAIPAYVDQIQITDVNKGYQQVSKVVFLVGANQQNFPFPKTQDGFLAGFERNKLKILLENHFPNREEDKIYSDSFIAYGSILSAQEKLFITCSKEQEPSRLFSLAQDIFPGVMLQDFTDMGWKDPRLFSSNNWKMHWTDQVKASLLEKKAIDQVEAYLGMGIASVWLEEPLDLAISEEDSLKSSMIVKCLGEDLCFNVSQIEQYSRCSYSYFLPHILRVWERKEFEVEARDIGSLLHLVTEKAFKEFLADWQNQKSIEEQTTLLSEYKIRDYEVWIDNILQEFVYPSPFTSALWRDEIYQIQYGWKIKQVAKHFLKVLVGQISPEMYVPQFLEWKFGQSSHNPLQIKVNPVGTASFKGIIDRIDIHQQNKTFRIIDYKTGNKLIDYQSIYQGLSLQLPAYLLAFHRSQATYEPDSLHYFQLSMPMVEFSMSDQNRAVGAEKVEKKIERFYDFKNLQLPLKNFETLEQHVETVLQQQVTAICQGKFRASPTLGESESLQNLPCLYCSYMSVCGIEPSQPPIRRLDNLKPKLAPDQTPLKGKELFNDWLEQKNLMKGEGMDETNR